MIPYAQIDPRLPGCQWPRAIAYYAQRVVTPPPLRRAVTGAIACVIRNRHKATPSPATMKAELADLRKHGISPLPPMFSEADLRDVQDYFSSAPLTLSDGRRVALSDVPAGVRAAGYDMATIIGSPHVLAAVNRPDILGLAAAYLGCRPTLSSLGVRWSFPNGDGREDVQAWHRDCDDWRTIKVFTYLTDVDPDAGPHVYVRGSHRTRATLKNERFTSQALMARYGEDNVLAVTGPSGTTFAADVAGIHRGVPPRVHARLILQAQYSLLPIQCFAYEPVASEAAAMVDPYVNRLIVCG